MATMTIRLSYFFIQDGFVRKTKAYGRSWSSKDQVMTYYDARFTHDLATVATYINNAHSTYTGNVLFSSVTISGCLRNDSLS